jgi:hypothetical protein
VNWDTKWQQHSPSPLTLNSTKFLILAKTPTFTELKSA